MEKMWQSIQRNLKGAKAPQMILNEQDKTTSILRDLTLHVHPILKGYLTKGTFFKPSNVKKWAKANNAKIRVVADNNSPLTEYHFYDGQTDDVIKL